MTMNDLLHPTAALVIRPLRLGPLRATPYGLCAGAGLMLAMAFARRSARRAGIDPEVAWNAGMFAILGCFLASRLLLVLRDPLAFTRYPLLVLSLPSLTYGGMAAAALLLAAYLRRKRLAFLPLLDVFAAPAALLAACLETGHALDGSEVGMPSALPWAVPSSVTSSVTSSAADSAARVHPVALYGTLLALLLTFALWGALRRALLAGRVAALGLALGGAAAFGLDTLSQPAFTAVNRWLEPGQWIALAAILAGAILWTFAPRATAGGEPAKSTRPRAPFSKLPRNLPSGQPFSPEAR